ncbi:nucleoside recognition domain-containing protein [Anaerotignum sp. MB30-C6]|uniref:nucleoside recognition domain-containing protein n=1 Tax=Anaerotignum sp. MB30-C6 TaxID=3070814 RepID=UPI0027DC80DD|nr:nucleoside recognition domain-containing protein [Anaerotignum sp. MB30-C6]WMI81737.1 nucleoside recognition domain-containing protein [Anaerotignum sp. MB30-C6]
MRKNSLVIICACFLVFALLRYPQAMLEAGGKSVTLWFNQVLPSLFPFMVACGILLRMGAAEIVGEWLRPLMKPLFGLPGVAAFPFFLGIFSGYPMGAKITASLFEEEKISLPQAEHILSFCNNPGPLFLVGTVGAAFFHAPFWGYLFLLCSFLGAVATGFLFRWFYQQKTPTDFFVYRRTTPPSITECLPRTIADSIDTITQIGGYIIIFGVAVEAFEQTGIFDFLGRVFTFLPFSKESLRGVCGGVLEMTNGTYLLSTAPDDLFLRLTASCILVAFGGLSILCQTFGILRNVPIKKSRYVAAKICNGLFSGIFFILLAPLLEKYAQKTVPTLALMAETAFSFPVLYVKCSLLFFVFALCFAFFKRK